MNRAVYRFLLKNSLGMYALAFGIGWLTLFFTSDVGDDGADYYVLFASPLAFGVAVLIFQNVFLNVVWGDEARALGALPLDRKRFTRFLWSLAVLGPPVFCGLGVGIGLLLSRRDFTYTAPTTLWILACQWVFAAGCAAAASLYASGKANRSVRRNKRQRLTRVGLNVAGWSSPLLVLGGGVLAAYFASQPDAYVFILFAWSAALMTLSYRFRERTWYPSVEGRAPYPRRTQFRHLLSPAKPALPVAGWYGLLVYSLMVMLVTGFLAYANWTGIVHFEIIPLLAPLTLGLGIKYVGTTLSFDNRVLRGMPVSRHGHVLILLGSPILLFVPSLIVLVCGQVVLGWNVPRSTVSFLVAFSLHCVHVAAATRFAHVWCQFLLWFGFMGLFIFAIQIHIEPHIVAGLAAIALVALCAAYAFLYRSIGQSDALYPRRIPYDTYDANWI